MRFEHMLASEETRRKNCRISRDKRTSIRKRQKSMSGERKNERKDYHGGATEQGSWGEDRQMNKWKLER